MTDLLNAILGAADSTKLEHPNGTVLCDNGASCPSLPIVPGTAIQAAEIETNGEYQFPILLSAVHTHSLEYAMTNMF